MEPHRKIQEYVKAQRAEFAQDLETYRIIQDDVEAQRAEMAEDMETYRVNAGAGRFSAGHSVESMIIHQEPQPHLIRGFYDLY
ncbi:MAG: hypothetical protein Q9221_000554 [Calogaya cf. arnoldii]